MAVKSETLRTLHRIYRQLSDLRSRLERGPKQIAAAQAKIEAGEKQVEDAKEEVKRHRMMADRKELSLKERESKIEDKRRKLNECSSNREYQSLLEQIAADEEANSVQSDEILELFDTITTLEQAVEDAKAELAQRRSDQAKLQTKIDADHALIEADLARLTEESAVYEKQIPADIKLEFERIVSGRGEEGLAPLEGEICGGCFTMINPNLINELLRQNLTLCRSCGCILYLPEDREAKHRSED